MPDVSVVAPSTAGTAQVSSVVGAEILPNHGRAEKQCVRQGDSPQAAGQVELVGELLRRDYTGLA